MSVIFPRGQSDEGSLGRLMMAVVVLAEEQKGETEGAKEAIETSPRKPSEGGGFYAETRAMNIKLSF